MGLPAPSLRVTLCGQPGSYPVDFPHDSRLCRRPFAFGLRRWRRKSASTTGLNSLGGGDEMLEKCDARRADVEVRVLGLQLGKFAPDTCQTVDRAHFNGSFPSAGLGRSNLKGAVGLYEGIAWRFAKRVPATLIAHPFLVGIAAVVDVKGWFAKWPEFLRSESELGMDNLDYVPAMTQMLDELEAIVGRT